MILPNWVIGYHGCDRAVGEAILSGVDEVHVSSNKYDWLGEGAYFWENSYARAHEWATLFKEKPKRSRGNINEPFVTGAIIIPGNCLDLAEAKSLQILKEAADEFRFDWRAHAREYVRL
ncbi:hypothetical protein DB346_09980 [Verrucomicrobia bacterium LW23]|nr:hypothetical protein DB346_09980 [Verrucomicrobia bacterium LW23]